MMETGLFNQKKVKLKKKKYGEKAIVSCVYFQLLNKVCVLFNEEYLNYAKQWYLFPYFVVSFQKQN